LPSSEPVDSPPAPEQDDHHDLGGDLVEFTCAAGGRQGTEQVVLGIGRGQVELIVDVVPQFHGRDARRGKLVLIDQSVEQLGARVRPPDQLVDVLSRHADQPCDDHHRQSVGQRAHPLDASIAEVVRPQPVEGVCGERFHPTNPLGRQLVHQHLAVHRMSGVVRGGENLRGSTEPIHLERNDGAVSGERHCCGQVGREILWPVDGVVDRRPVAHQMKPGLADAMNRPFRAEAIVERVRILQRVDTDELNRILKQLHFSRLTSVNDGGNGPAKSREARQARTRRRCLTPPGPPASIAEENSDFVSQIRSIRSLFHSREWMHVTR
jgi:hypothetical protein